MGTIALKRSVGKGEATSDDRPAPVPKARYLVVIDSIEDAEDKYGGVKVAVTIDQGDFKGRTVESLRVFPGGKYGPSEALRSFIELVGGDAESDSFDYDAADYTGLRAYAFLDVKSGKKGGEYNIVTRFAPAPKLVK